MALNMPNAKPVYAGVRGWQPRTGAYTPPEVHVRRGGEDHLTIRSRVGAESMAYHAPKLLGSRVAQFAAHNRSK